MGESRLKMKKKILSTATTLALTMTSLSTNLFAQEIIEDWTLEFDFNRGIEKLLTAEIIEHESKHSESTYYVFSQLDQVIDYEKDTDKDGLPDFFEKNLGTAPNKVDTDGDGLTDGYEYFDLATDPLKADTDGNGMLDGNEDIDKDRLTNLEEYRLGTSPYNKDTDCDDIEDYDEVNIYKTSPLNADTDNDKLEDGDEILLGFEPLKPDTNKNGLLDGDEKVYQVYEQTISQVNKAEIVKVSVAFAGSGNLQKTTRIDNMYNIDILSSEVVGLVGVPVEINTASQFDKATITFEYNESKLGDIPEENLCIMWYDEENEWYHILDQDSIIDTVNNTVSVETTHLSTYLVVDRQDWYKVWSQKLDYRILPHSFLT